MNITIEERKNAAELIDKFLKHKDNLPYANIGHNNKYLGWVEDFHLVDAENNKIELNLKDKNDLFLLFILAVVWSRTGRWENSAFFVSYLKTNKKDTVDYWADKTNQNFEEENRKQTAIDSFNQLKGIVPRTKISFRKDIFASIHLLANIWPQVLQKLDESEKSNDFSTFMLFMRNIEGLAGNKRRMLIKIPLILRELRCQKIYSNISGEFCCVPDERVFKAGEQIKIKINKNGSLERLIENSTKIYRLFGDLYDLPLFAYEDLQTLE